MSLYPIFISFEKEILQEKPMRVCAVICEYNPFHNGHAHHLRQARERSRADYLVCVMSGCITQRGTFARHDPLFRARTALQCGADLVIGLPARFSVAPAGEFAGGALSLIRDLGVVTHLSFGCEEEALPLLFPAARLLSRETPAFREALRRQLGLGRSYPHSRAAALEEAGLPGAGELLGLPNASLACEYLIHLPEGITPVPVLREGAGHGQEPSGGFCSAGALRTRLEAGDTGSLPQFVPDAPALLEQERTGRVHEEEALTQTLLYLLRTTPEEDLEHIFGMEEGLCHRFARAAREAVSREALLGAVKCRRYTHTRLSRAAACLLLGITREFWQATPSPTFARILAFRREASPLISRIQESAAIPVGTLTRHFSREDPLFALDVRARDLWALGCSCPSMRTGGSALTSSPVIL